MPYSALFSLTENKVTIDNILLPEIEESQVTIDLLRLDNIHPVISGNKLFKLSHYLEEVLNSRHKTILTFGGSYSNHLSATAFACNLLQIRSIGIVRRTEKESNSSTVADCRNWGMNIHFMERTAFRSISEHPKQIDLAAQFGEHIAIPLGGSGLAGVRGAAQIMDFIPEGRYNHICVPVGTATTLAGLLLADRDEKIAAFPALKGLNDIHQRLDAFGINPKGRLMIFPEFHFGGFAKRTPELLNFMNDFYQSQYIPLDFVYTAKMMFGITKLVQQGDFPPGTKLLAIHTGGLQGNRSLPEGFLCY